MSAPVVFFSGPAGIGKSHQLHLYSTAQDCAGRCQFFALDPGADALSFRLNQLLEDTDPACLAIDDLQRLSSASARALLEWIDKLAELISSGEALPTFRLLLAARPRDSVGQDSATITDWISRLSLLPFVEHHALKPLDLAGTYRMLEELIEHGGAEADPGELNKLAAEIQARSGGHPFVSRLLYEELSRGTSDPTAQKPAELVEELLLEDLRENQSLAEIGTILAMSPHPVSRSILSDVLSAGETELESLIAPWILKGFLVSKANSVSFAHDLFRERYPSTLARDDWRQLLTAFSRALDESQHSLRTSLLLQLVQDGAVEAAELITSFNLWRDTSPGDPELEEFCFQMSEKGRSDTCRTAALSHLHNRQAWQRHRERWMRLLDEINLKSLDPVLRAHSVFTLVPTLDHTGRINQIGQWLKRLEQECEPHLIATAKIDFAMNRLLKNDQKTIRGFVDGEALRAAFAPDDPLRENRLAQIGLLELFLSHDIVGDPAAWLAVLEEFYKQQGATLDPWNHDRLVTIIVDAAGRARDGLALERWQEPAIQSAREVAKVEPEIFGRARVARRKMHFGRSGDCIDDLLAAANWNLSQGNLRMALPDLDAAATSHFKHGRVSQACEILREVEALVLHAPLEFLTAAFRINATAPFLADGDWQSAERWLAGLEPVLEKLPQIRPSHEYAEIQVLDRKAMGGRLPAKSLQRLEELAESQLKISPPEGQRAAELKAVLWVNQLRAGKSGPTADDVYHMISNLEEHNINPRAQAVAQLAECASLAEKSSGQSKAWRAIAQNLVQRMQCDTGPDEIIYRLQLARLAKLDGNRVLHRAWLFEAMLASWLRKSRGWQNELKRLFPKVRLDGLASDTSRDRMSHRARQEWMSLLASQCHPGPRLRAFGIDLSHENPRELLSRQLERVRCELPRWRQQAASEQLNKLEQTVIRLEQSASELPDPSTWKRESIGLQVKLIGTLRLIAAGKELSTSRLGNGIFRELFAFLVVERWRHPGRAWAPLDLIEKVWRVKGRDREDLLNSFYVYVSHLRALLKSTGFPGCLEHDSEGYRIHVDCPVELDLQEFDSGMAAFRQKGRIPDEEALLAFLSAFAHSIDPSLSSGWLDELRAWHEQRWFELHHRLSGQCKSSSVKNVLAKLEESFYPD